jgi:6-pyruvoyltetrahydropterin/6-carboxytetrahydropterin synthase
MDSPTGSSCGSTNSDHPILPKKKNTPIAYLTRCETFCAGHRLMNTSLDDDTNRDLFGKCTNFHGHNYKVEVTVKGPVNKISGMVMNVSELRDIMAMVIEPLDHRNLDQDIEYFQSNGKVATAENIAIYLWDKIKKLLPHETTLTNLRLHETDKNFLDYKGELEDSSLDSEDG